MSTWPAALAGRPLLVAESRAIELRDGFLAADVEAREMQAAGRSFSTDSARYAVQDGVAIIPVSGVLLNRYEFFGDGSPYTSYAALTREIDRAAGDAAIRGIVLGVNSPGGTADGMLVPAAAIRAARRTKPVRAFVGSIAASGGYWLAAQSDEIVLRDDLSQVGSIGVYTMHMSVARLAEQAGVDISVIYSGEHKVDGHPFAPLPDSVRAEIQQEVDDLRLTFAREVAAGRPSLSAKAALDTEAKVFAARDPKTGASPAISAKLADRIGSLASVISAFPKSSPQIQTRGAISMDEATIRADERARISAIMNSPEAAGREGQATYLACQTDNPADVAIGILASSAKAGATSTTSYEARKAASGAGGFVDEPRGSIADTKSIWSQARKGAGSDRPGSVKTELVPL